MLVAEPELRNVLLVGACRESYLLDYANVRSRFMFNFGDGAAAGLLVKGGERNELLGSHGVTDGSLSLQVKVARGGSVHMDDGYPFLDVDDPAAMKEQLDASSLRNFVRTADVALGRSGLRRGRLKGLTRHGAVRVGGFHFTWSVRRANAPASQHD